MVVGNNKTIHTPTSRDWYFCQLKFLKNFDYVSVNSKPGHPPGDSHVPIAPGIGLLLNFLSPGGWGFEFEEFSIVWKEKCSNFSICFKETGGRMKSRCSYAVSYQFLHKHWMSTVSLIT